MDTRREKNRFWAKSKDGQRVEIIEYATTRPETGRHEGEEFRTSDGHHVTPLEDGGFLIVEADLIVYSSSK